MGPRASAAEGRIEMVTGIMVFDDKHQFTPAQLIEEGRKVFKRRFKLEPTHAVIPVGVELPTVDGIIVSQQKYVRPWHALVGCPGVADASAGEQPGDRPHKTEDF